jgi:hypothetical protein
MRKIQKSGFSASVGNEYLENRLTPVDTVQLVESDEKKELCHSVHWLVRYGSQKVGKN